MEPVSYREFRDEHLSRIVPAYFYITTRERNAWWGSESRQYRGLASLTCTLAAAKKVAEGWRAQGSAFTIQQVPGLHVMSEWTDLGLVEFHSNDSFAKWDSTNASKLRAGTPLSTVLDALGPLGEWRGVAPSTHSFVSGVLESDDVVTPLGPRASFAAWTSFSQGGDYRLGWNERPGRHKAPGVRNIARLSSSQDAPGR